MKIRKYLLLVVFLLPFLSACDILTADIHGTVQDTYVKNGSGNEGQTFFVAVKKDDGSTEVFEDVDTMNMLKFNSADVYQQMILAQKDGQPVHIEVQGMRIPLFSSYRNIVRVY